MIRDKATMYRMLAAGELGNTVEQWFKLRDWLPHALRYPLWGVRSLLPMDKRSALNLPLAEVVDYVRHHFPDGRANISPMIDRYAVLRGEVAELDGTGLFLHYVPPTAPIDTLPAGAHVWRESFARWSKTAERSGARAILESYLWPGDLDNIQTLLERFPGHVIEFSACDRAVGVVPMRNTIVWEVRLY